MNRIKNVEQSTNWAASYYSLAFIPNARVGFESKVLWLGHECYCHYANTNVKTCSKSLAFYKVVNDLGT